jgi:tetratricopeptide (TPR) repeat protein
MLPVRRLMRGHAMALYDAFVSYSHAKDKPIAAALQSVAQKLGKPWYRRRALRVFRDDTSLAATPSLWPSIEQALGQSRFLILLASSEAMASPWVNKEVAYWLEHKSVDRLLIALTDGDLTWDNSIGDFARRERMPLPPVLAGRFSSEPKWVDMRAYRDGANPRDSKFIEASADFAAAIHGMPKEDLLSREVRQQRRALTLAWAAAGSLLILVGVAGWQWKAALDAEHAAIEQRQIAEHQRDQAERNFGIAKDGADHVVFNLAQSLRSVQGMRVESVRRILDAAQVMMDQLARAAPEDLKLQQSRSAMLTEFVVTYLAAGDLTRARTAAEDGLTITRKLAAADPGNADWQHGLSVSLNRVGDVRLAAGDGAGALAAYEESLGVRRKLAAADPDNTDWQHGLSVSLKNVGYTRLAAGDRPGALAVYEESLAIARKLIAIDPGNGNRDNVQGQRDLSTSLTSVGDLRRAAGDSAGALEAYEESLGVVRQLAAVDHDDTQSQRNLSSILGKVGDIHRAAGEQPAALAAYEESLGVMRKLADADPDNAKWQRDLGVGLANVGDVKLAAGDRAGALADYEKSLGIMRRLSAADPGDAEGQSSLAGSLTKVGDVRRAAFDFAGALAAYEESLGVMRKLAAVDPGNTLWRRHLSLTLNRVGDMRRTPFDRAAGLTAYEEGLDVMRKLVAIDPGNADWQRDLSVSLEKVGDVLLAVGEQARARAFYEESLGVMRRLSAADPGNAQWQPDLLVNLVKASTVSEPPSARQALGEALTIAEALARDGKLTVAQKNWPQLIRARLAALPPEQDEAR